MAAIFFGLNVSNRPMGVSLQLTKFTNPTMSLYTTFRTEMYTCTCVLWDIGEVYCGIYLIGLSPISPDEFPWVWIFIGDRSIWWFEMKWDYSSTSPVLLQWRHNGHDGVSNHQPHHCLLNRLFGRRSKKTSKLRVTGLCAGNSPGTGEFPAQMASNAENVSIWWRHHGVVHLIPNANYNTGWV